MAKITSNSKKSPVVAPAASKPASKLHDCVGAEIKPQSVVTWHVGLDTKVGIVKALDGKHVKVLAIVEGESWEGNKFPGTPGSVRCLTREWKEVTLKSLKGITVATITADAFMEHFTIGVYERQIIGPDGKPMNSSPAVTNKPIEEESSVEEAPATEAAAS